MRVFSSLQPIAVLLALGMALSCTGARADELSEAGKLLRAGKSEQALAHVDHVLTADPGNARARFLQGLIFADQGKDDDAISVFQKLTVDYPELPEPHNNLAVLYAAHGQYEKARTALEQSIRTHPSYATAYENLGDVYAKLASQAYDKALRLDSSNTAAQHKLALVRDLVGEGGAPRAPAPGSGAAPVAPVAAAAAPAAPPAPATPPTPVQVAAVSTPAPVASSAVADDPLQAVRAWAAAWSHQDVSAYLDAYAADFAVPGGASRADWEAQRRERLIAPKKISVEVENARAHPVDDRHSRVTFVQRYQSDRFKSTSRKTLVLGRSDDGRWRILEERIGQ
ncbi:MAG TPA: tetratricopeptide repeat protein [Burkholderiales bacterium]|nr:tetratricopeptide repeat protein [Burkholderiales bacterium]